MNNLKQLPRLMVFATVAHRGSFTQAATSLGITKSAVSQQIKVLEEEMGIRLLNRTTRGISLTALGEKLLLRCTLLQDQVELVFADISAANENPKGRFAVTFPHALEASVVMPAITQLCTEFPGLEPDLVVNDSRLDLVENKLDVAIHAGELPDSSYRALPVGTITEIFCATPLFMNKKALNKAGNHASTPSTPQALVNFRWIATSWQQHQMTVFNVKNNEKFRVELNQFARVNTLPSALEMALRHLGMVLLPDVVARPLIKSGELVHILDQFRGPLWPVYTMHAYRGEKPLHLTRFHQLVCRYFNSLLT